MKSRTVLLFVLGTLLALVLTACSSQSPASQPSEPAVEPQAGSYPPVILRVVERQEVIDGFQYSYADIYFTDPDGDAVAGTYREVSTSLTHPVPLSDDPIEASAVDQKGEALFTAGGRCPYRMELAFEMRIRDRAGNLSEPVTTRLSCTTPPVVDTGSILGIGFSIALVIALILGLVFWLLFRKSPAERLPALRSTLLLFCLALLVGFISLILHEGGHALYVVFHGVPALLYVHPFSFPGYGLPMIDTSTWFNVLGSLTALLFSMLISLSFWRRRSLALLPLVMLFPIVAIGNGLNMIGAGGADFRNPVQYNSLSPIPFQILGMLIVVAGIVLLLSLFPLLGLHPKDKRALFVVPAASFLVCALSLPIAVILVPGSPIDREYFLGQEIVSGASMLLVAQPVMWALFAVLYVTLWRRVYPRLPAWLRTETVALTWKDLRLPAVLAVICVILGILIIT